jgi:amino-acid N-acetyltransferase
LRLRGGRVTDAKAGSVSALLETGQLPRQIVIERAQTRDLGTICQLLDLASLPHEDVTEELLRHFLIGRLDTRIIGVVGLEPYQDVALLRSLAVAKEHSRVGFGKQLVAAAEELAADMKIKSTYLLTTTADRFFEGLGFRRLQRDLAPPAIKSCHQFASLCPASAVLMVKP